MFTRTLDQASTLPAVIAVFYSALNVSVSVHHRICGQFFDPDCFSQSVFSLSTNIHRVVYASGYILGQISIFTSTAISVETRLLLMGLRYIYMCNNFWSYRLSCVTGTALSAPCVVISIFSYPRIFLRLRQRQNRKQSHDYQGQTNRGEIPLKLARYKRTVSTIAWVQLAMVAFYVPMSVSSK